MGIRQIAFVVTMVAIAYTAYAFQKPPSKEEQHTMEQEAKVAVESVEISAPVVAKQEGKFPADYVMGNPDAKVTIMEYSSMTCPHCAHFHKDIFPTIKAKYIDTGKIAYIFRHFPLDKTAFDAARLSHCSGKDRYYKFVDVFFKMQRQWALADNPTNSLKSLAKLGGMSEETIQNCLNDKALEDSILLDMKERASAKYKVNSTPSVFINGVLVDGEERTIENVSKKIDEALK